ncbi:glutaredoxin-1 [Hemiscyllium ocellatum]|uniref:glutaredoxin-1 n=1 Tax=Hemiscyllium ocellatum TaxID=170820 RepID=UPI002966ABCB|nr:glutaredoxin-1 [Hemiscyllium ocellatum]
MAQDYVDSKIHADKVVLFIKQGCPYCISARNVLEAYDFKQGRLQIYDISGLPEMKAIQDYFEKITGARTVPRVFIGTECVGGGSDVVKLENDGLLKGKLSAIGAI